MKKFIQIAFGKCGCFYCCKTFNIGDVDEFVDDGKTAICPKCGIDSVLIFDRNISEEEMNIILKTQGRVSFS